MSLINDALRRAKEQPAPEAPGPHLHPAEMSQKARHGLGVMVPVGLGVIALLVLFLLWQVVQAKGHGKPPTVAASEAKNPPRQVTVTETVRVPAPKPGAVGASDAPTPGQQDIATNMAAAGAEPAPLRLQGVVFSPTRPSAMISGQTVFVGDYVGEQRVAAISPMSVTLVGGGQTNVLSLK